MSPSNHQGLMIVVPTRNRADLAVNSIRSALGQAGSSARVLVSDNSTRPEDVELLSNFCRPLSGERLRYVRPPEPMSMPLHWEWVMGEALADGSVSHVAYLTDRMIFKRGALRKLEEVIAAHPSKVISYNHDMVSDFERPVRLQQLPRTGLVFGVDTAELIALSARSVFPHCMPRMLNSVAPRTVVDALRERFGSVFCSVPPGGGTPSRASVSPDYCFSYRCLTHEETVVYFDETLIAHYALARSNGHSFARGVLNQDSKDFVENLGGELRYAGLPLEEFVTCCNAILYEYCYVRDESRSAKFLPIDRQAYVDRLAVEVEFFEDARAREAAKRLLAQHGAKPFDGGGRSLPRKVADKIRWEMCAPATKQFWMLLARTLKIRPPGDQRFGFDSAEEALDYTQRYPRRRARGLGEHPFKCVPLPGPEPAGR